MHVIVHDFTFPGKMTPPLTANADGGVWCKADTSAAGAPTLAAAGGYMVGQLANSDEAENLCLYFGDSLSFDIDDLLSAEFWIKVSGALPAGTDLAFGLCSARADAIDDLAAHASFRLLGAGTGASALTVETDDGTHDVDDIAAGQALGTTLKRFVIDFASGVQTVAPPGLSKGGKAAVKFSADDSRGNLQVVAVNQLFDMSGYAAGLQPYVQIQKTGGAGTPSFSLRRVRITERLLA
jgi:hypothetical protein